MPVFDRHEVTITPTAPGNRFRYRVDCVCTWQGHADSEDDADRIGKAHQAARGYVPEPKKADIAEKAAEAPVKVVPPAAPAAPKIAVPAPKAPENK